MSTSSTTYQEQPIETLSPSTLCDRLSRMGWKHYEIAHWLHISNNALTKYKSGAIEIPDQTLAQLRNLVRRYSEGYPHVCGWQYWGR